MTVRYFNSEALPTEPATFEMEVAADGSLEVVRDDRDMFARYDPDHVNEPDYEFLIESRGARRGGVEAGERAYEKHLGRT